MTNKTPISELIEFIKEELNGSDYEYQVILSKCNEFKTKEKNIIVDAWEDGFYPEYKDGQDYFNQTFKQ